MRALFWSSRAFFILTRRSWFAWSIWVREVTTWFSEPTTVCWLACRDFVCSVLARTISACRALRFASFCCSRAGISSPLKNVWKKVWVSLRALFWASNASVILARRSLLSLEKSRRYRSLFWDNASTSSASLPFNSPNWAVKLTLNFSPASSCLLISFISTSLSNVSLSQVFISASFWLTSPILLTVSDLLTSTDPWISGRVFLISSICLSKLSWEPWRAFNFSLITWSRREFIFLCSKRNALTSFSEKISIAETLSGIPASTKQRTRITECLKVMECTLFSVKNWR